MRLQLAELKFAEAARELTQARAEADGETAGRQDFLLGRLSRYAWFVESNPGYSQSYSIGYRRGWIAASRSSS